MIAPPVPIQNTLAPPPNMTIAPPPAIVPADPVPGVAPVIKYDFRTKKRIS